MTRHAKAFAALIASFMLLLATFGFAATAAFALQTHTPGTPFDGSQVPNGSFGALGGIAVDQSGGDIYVIDASGSEVDSSGAVQHFSSTGAFEAPQLNGASTSAGNLSLFSESHVAIDSSGTPSDGTAYLADSFNNLVVAFDPATGNLQGAFDGDGQLGGSGMPTPLGSFSTPCGVAVDQSNGNVLVADQNNNRIWIFDSSGKYLDRIADSTLSGPCGIALTASGDLYVRNAYDGGKVLRFNKLGATEYAFSSLFYSPETEPGASDIAIGPADHLYVDKGDRITEYDAGGSVVSTFGQESLGDSHGIAVDSSSGTVYASNGNELKTFGALVTLPDVTSGPASAISTTAATLSGSLDLSGAPKTSACSFEWGTDTSYGNSVPCAEGNVFTSSATVSAELAGLTAESEYHYRLHVESPDGKSNGKDRAFATDGAPVVSSYTIANADTSGAKLNAQINPAGAETSYHFEYVDEATFNASEFSSASKVPAPDASIGSGNSSQVVTQILSGLTPGTTYHFRVLATNAVGTTPTAAKTFKTFAVPVPPNRGQFPGQGFLPNDRAWEMVSPPDKNGGDVLALASRTRAAVDGDAIQFTSVTAFGDVKSIGVAADYFARRTAIPGTNGWTTHGIMPPQKALNAFAAFNSLGPYYVGEFSPDLDRGVFRSFSPVPTAGGLHPAVALRVNFYMRSDLATPGTGTYQLLSDCPACATPLPFELDTLDFAGANMGDSNHEPLTNVVYESRRNLTADTSTLSPFVAKLFEGTVKGTEEIQEVKVGATAGTFTLAFDAQSTPAIPFDAPAATVQSKLNALSSIGGAGGSVAVSGGPGDASGTSPYVLSFGGLLGNVDVAQIDVDSSALSGTATVATRLPGGQHVRLVGRIPILPALSCDDQAAPACVGTTSTAGPANGASTHTAYPFHVISDNGSRIFFRAPASGSVRRLYMREDGDRTTQISASEREPPDVAQTAEYRTAAADGSRVFFSTEEPLTNDDDNRSPDLYMYDASKPTGAPDNLTLISKGSGGSGEVSGVIGASDDGHYVYFTSKNPLISGDPVGRASKLYLWHDGSLAFLGAFGLEASQGGIGNDDIENGGSTNLWTYTFTQRTSRVTPDGRHLLFMSRSSEGLTGHGGFDGYDHGSSCTFFPGGPCRELFVYSADNGQLRCASCNPAGISLTPLGDALSDITANAAALKTTHLSHAISDDGRYVYFFTGERLVPEDTNGQIDAYQYDTVTEKQRLISSGESKAPSYFIDASDDGKDIFFLTRERLSAWDVDTSFDIYDARVGGGLPEPPPLAASCQGDACQPPPLPLNDPTPGSASFSGPGNPKTSRKKRHHKPKKRHSKRTANGNRKAGR